MAFPGMTLVMPSDDVPDGFEPLEGAGPLIDHVGPLYLRAHDRVLAFRADSRHLNRAGTVHGGLLATLVDTALGSAIRDSDDEDRGLATVSLTTDYLSAGKEGDWIEAHTEVERLGGSLAFADCSLRVDGREIVRGRAVFAVLS